MPNVIIKIRRDTAANWNDANPTLVLGEAAYETDTRKLKVGDGIADWDNLNYIYTHEANDIDTKVASLLTSGSGVVLDYDSGIGELAISAIPYIAGDSIEISNNIVSYTGISSYEAGEGLQITNTNLISFTGLPQFQDTYAGSINSTHNNWNPGVTAQTIRVTGSDGILTGMSSDVYPNSIFLNIGDQNITIKHDHPNSETQNRFLAPNNRDYVVPPSGGSVRIIRDYVDNSWRVLGFSKDGIADEQEQQVYSYGSSSLVFVYDTTKVSGKSIIFPVGGVNPNIEVNWGDSSTTKYTSTGLKFHHYPNDGTYVVQVTGSMTALDYLVSPSNNYGKEALVKCLSFGTVGLTSIDRAFYNCSNLNELPSILYTGITSMENAVYGTTSLDDSNLVTWNTSNVTNIEGMFTNSDTFNQQLSAWSLFNVTSLDSVFENASAFNSNVSLWNTSNVTSTRSTFRGATNFNQVVASWDMSRVTDMSYMFADAQSFNRDLSWTTTACTNMAHMFSGSLAFDSNVDSFNTSNVTDMSAMFADSLSFNQNISSWSTSSVTTMSHMFDGASSFDQDLSGWDISGLNSSSSLNNFMKGVTLSTSNYDNLLNYWNTNKNSYLTNLSPNFGLSKYSASASAARSALISYGWAITDGGLA